MQGIRILEVAEHTFVPAAAAILADWGADIIKIEPVERGDAMRGLASSGTISLGSDGWHPLLHHANRGKRSIALNLMTPEGVEILRKLAATSDVFLTNKLPAVRTRLGIDVDDIRAVNPSIVYVRGHGYGARGPEADRGGYDVLGYWSRSGAAAAAKPVEVNHITAQPGPAYGDSIGAMTIAGGIAAALLYRERTGKGTIVDVSLLGTGMWAMGSAIALGHQFGIPWGQFPVDQNVGNPLTAAYQTSDEKWVFFSCLQAFRYWADACRVLKLPELVADARFATADLLRENSSIARDILRATLKSATLAEWKVRLSDFEGQWSPVQNTLEVLDDEQVIANGYIVHAEDDSGGQHPLVATPVQFDDEPSPTRRAPDFNEHGDDILLGELGLDWDAIVNLKLKGILA